MTLDQTFVQQALQYARRGWAVFPLGTKGKMPAIPKAEGGNGYKDATTDPATIREWWEKYPDANIGIACGASGLAVVDVDVKNGAPGMQTWLALLPRIGAGNDNTPTVQTPTGGLHYYFYLPQGGQIAQGTNKLGPGVDVKAAGGYVLAPPSIHPDTNTAYTWVDGYNLDDRPVLPLPSALVKMLEPKQAPSAPRSGERDVFALGRDITEAGRALQRLAPWRCEDYDAWVNVGMALSELGAAGLELWDKWSEQSAKYDSEVCAQKWQTFEPGNGRTLASLFHWAKEDSGEPDRVTHPTMQPDPGDPPEEPDYMADAPLYEDVPPADAFPKIRADEQNLRIITAEAWEAIKQVNNVDPYLFCSGGIPSRLDRDGGRPVIRELTPDRLRYEVARAATWYSIKTTGEVLKAVPAKPPMYAIKDMLAARSFPLPRLVRIVEAPVFAPDGALQTKPGYHSKSETYLEPAKGVNIPNIPTNPTASDIEQARQLLCDELLGEFPFVDEPDRAHAVALLLLPFVRDMIPDPTPNHLIEAPCPGSGKGLLADVLMLPSLGRNVSLVAEARDDDEWRKRISAALREGRAAVQIDNVARPLISGVLAAALTAPVWTDRVLGYSEMFSTPVRCVWLTTANNPTMSTEIARRCIQIRLDPKMDRPWLREGFRHADLRAWATARRGELIGAALTLVQAWVAAGKPKAHVKPLGSYEHWSAVLGGILETAGIPGFLGNLMQLYERADTEGATWRRFVAEWWERFKDQEVKAADLFPIALDMDGFDLGKGKTERAQKIAFGKALGRQRDRVIGQYRITQTGTAQRIALWQLQNVEQAEQEVYVVYNGVCSVPSPTPQNESSGFSDRAPDIHEHTQHTCQDADEVVLI
jgi:hypothetical protein